MKTKLSFLWVAAFVSTLSSPAALAAGEDRHLFQVRMNSLDVLSEKILPQAAQRMGLDRLRVPDQQLVNTRWGGYDITVTLREIRGSVPFSTSAPFKNGVRLDFAPGNLLTARLAAPDARVTMQLSVAIDSHRWYQPGIFADFPVTGQGLTGFAATMLSVSRDDLVARTYSLSGLEVGRVEVGNIGLLSKIFGTILRHTNMCGGTRSLEDCITRTVNKQLGRLITAERFLKPLVDPVLYEVSGATRALFSREDKIASIFAGIETLETSARTATLGWGLQLKPKGKAAACAAGLVPSTREHRLSFDWSRQTTGDFEATLPHSLLEDYLYAFARQGTLCISGSTEYLGVKFDYTVAPAETITLATSANGELVLRLPVRASLASTPGQRGSIAAKELRAAIEVVLDFDNGSPKGLCLAPRQVALVDLEGSIAFSGLRVPLLDLRPTLENELSATVMARLATVCFLPKHSRLNPTLAVRLGERSESGPAHLWSSFEFESN